MDLHNTSIEPATLYTIIALNQEACVQLFQLDSKEVPHSSLHGITTSFTVSYGCKRLHFLPQRKTILSNFVNLDYCKPVMAQVYYRVCVRVPKHTSFAVADKSLSAQAQRQCLELYLLRRVNLQQRLLFCIGLILSMPLHKRLILYLNGNSYLKIGDNRISCDSLKHGINEAHFISGSPVDFVQNIYKEYILANILMRICCDNPVEKINTTTKGNI